MRILHLIGRVIRLLLVCILACLLLASSSLPPGNNREQVRAFTRNIEFDFIEWTINALWVKLNQFALGTESYLTADLRRQTVQDYLETISRMQQLDAEINAIYSDPTVLDPQVDSLALRRQKERLQARHDQLAPVAEAVLQRQIADVAAASGLTLGGQPVPPVLYHSTPLPRALIISPRDIIRQDADISLVPEISLDQQAALEDRVDHALNVSSLTVNIGGVGLYPTMVYQTRYLDAISEVVAHEWIHNFLTLRPLGINYLKSPELRIMNETAATIAGKEIGRAVMERYYPELLPPPAAVEAPANADGEEKVAPVFDYNLEMRNTRIAVDQFLADGKIEEAEEYMKSRRVVFWDQGYRHLRKLNQAYFAFYGAYADHPSGGAAGVDPVGAAVRALRQQSPTLEVFLKRIAWMSSFEELERAVGGQ